MRWPLLWCFLFGHVPKRYCETVQRVEEQDWRRQKDKFQAEYMKRVQGRLRGKP